MFMSQALQHRDRKMGWNIVEMDSGTSYSVETSYSNDSYIFITESDIAAEDEALEDDAGADDETIKSMLAFVAVWDPADDVLFLSHPNSDHGSLLTEKPQLYPSEYISDLQSLDIPSVPSSSRSSICYQSLREDHEPLFSGLSLEQRSLRGMTQTSSTLGGLDVYLKGAALALTHRHQPVYSVLDFSSDFQFDASSVGVVEGCRDCTYLSRRNVLQLTPTCDIPPSRAETDNWSTIESPTTEELQHMGNPFDSLRSHHGRRLKKRRPSEARSSPIKEPEVITEHTPPVHHNHHMPFLTGTRLFKGFLSIGKLIRREDNDWIWIEAQN